MNGWIPTPSLGAQGVVFMLLGSLALHEIFLGREANLVSINSTSSRVS
jgi:membrane associated rhomboid family serine protease